MMAPSELGEPRPLSPEDRLILLLAPRSQRAGAEAEARTLLAGGLSWPAVLARARLHGVHPFLHASLERLGFPGVPAGARSELEADCRAAAIRSGLLARELASILAALSEASVPAIPLKGAALSASLYGDPTLRVATDLDVLVPRSLAARALRLLGERGYRSEFAGRSFESLLLETTIERALSRKERGLSYPLELHWGVLWGHRLDRGATADLWAEARPAEVLGAPALAPSPEWDLLFLAAHAARHRWQGLKWLVDVHQVCARGGIDWRRVREKARRFGWEKIVSLTLTACRRLLGTVAPPGFALEEPPRWMRLYPADLAPGGRETSLDYLRLLERRRDRLRHLIGVLWTPTLAERRLIPLPAALSFLYRPLRAVRIGARWCRLRAAARQG